MRFIATAFLALASAFGSFALAQEPPERAGRLALVEGTVSVYQDPDMGWDRAYVNLPITSENSVWTDRGARAEVRVSGTALRLDELTQLDIARLDGDEIDAQIERGTVAIRVRSKQRNERLAFSTPHARFVLLADGRYRIDVDAERDESRLTVFSGDARMISQGGRVRVEAGKTVVVWGQPSPSYAFERATSDAFDRWTLARDAQWTTTRSSRYVSSYMTGYEDLDRYGNWVDEPEYGALWYPTRVSSDWAPYRHGHWSYIRPWGWTWVDDAPWGYAPFHYGRWVQVRDRWAWYPGRRVERPTWAPALVAFIGGSNWNVGISSGGSAPAVGWYPLSPWERYQPWYQSNTGYANRVNVVVSERTPRQFEGRSDWRTWNRDRGTTVVQRDTIVNRQPVANAMVRVAPESVRGQAVVAPAQIQQALPQRNEFIRQRGERQQAAAPVAAPPAPRLPSVGGAPVGQAPASAATASQPANVMVRPDFSRRAQRTEPAPAPANQAPPQSRLQPAAPQDRSAREMQQQQERALREQQQQQERALREQQQQQERAAREAQQQQERAAREAQQQQERAAREAQQRERAAREGQQRDAQQRAAREAQQQQERAAREAQQQQERAAREAQQREAQQRAAREAQQQQERAAREAQQQQERAAREAQQRDAQQRAAREAQQQQERAAREAQQQQERAAREAQQQKERAAREAQQQAQQAQQAAERAAREAQQAAQRAAREAQQPQPAQPAQAQQPATAPAPPANPQARGERGKGRERAKTEKEEQDEKDEKEKEKEKEKKSKR